jgi:hypothetical protein
VIENSNPLMQHERDFSVLWQIFKVIGKWLSIVESGGHHFGPQSRKIMPDSHIFGLCGSAKTIERAIP